MDNKVNNTDTLQKDEVIKTEPENEEKEITENKKILIEKAQKYDLISESFEILKRLSAADNMSVPEFLENLKRKAYEEKIQKISEKCGGDNEFAEYIMKLEENNAVTEVLGFDELKQNVPEITSIEQLPKSVVESASLKGTLLFDEYLRYLFEERKNADEAIKKQKNTENNSVGSQLNRKNATSPETAEFLKGLWK